MLNILSRQEDNSSSHLRYFIPVAWWQYFLDSDEHMQNSQDFIVSDLPNIEEFTQTIDSREKQALIELVEQKLNYLQIDNYIFSPKLKTGTKWKTVSTKLYDFLKKRIGSSLSLPFLDIQNSKNSENGTIFIGQNTRFKRIKLLLCSKSQNHLIDYFIDKETQTKSSIKEVILFFEYRYTQNTKITFLETNQGQNFKFQQCSIDLLDKKELIMIHGLERVDQKMFEQNFFMFEQQKLFVHNFQSPRMARVSRNDEEITMADEDSRSIQEHTMSTGAQTPFTFEFEDQDWDLFRPYQNHALFGQKLQQEIENMKQYAREAIFTNIIQSTSENQQSILKSLSKIAEDIIENIEKKKMYQKQIVKDSKEYFKEGKQIHHAPYPKDKQSSVFHEKDIFGQFRSFQNVKEQCKAKKKQCQISQVVHYTSENQNS